MEPFRSIKCIFKTYKELLFIEKTFSKIPNQSKLELKFEATPEEEKDVLKYHLENLIGSALIAFLAVYSFLYFIVPKFL